MTETIADIAKRHGKAFANDLVDLYLIEALEKAVAKSATPIDDAVLVALKEPLKTALKELINKA